jgi:hypothetical protein
MCSSLAVCVPRWPPWLFHGSYTVVALGSGSSRRAGPLLRSAGDALGALASRAAPGVLRPGVTVLVPARCWRRLGLRGSSPVAGAAGDGDGPGAGEGTPGRRTLLAAGWTALWCARLAIRRLPDRAPTPALAG